MDKILSVIIFALLGAAAVKYLQNFLRRQKNNKSKSNNRTMSKNKQMSYEHVNRSSAKISSINEPKASALAIIFRSEMDYISRCILDYPNIETGGQLFGYWTSDGSPVVCYVIGPGKNAQHNTTSFIQDWEYVKKIGTELHGQFRLQHIGEWHSHHQLGLAHPSSGDVNTMSYGVGKPGFPRLLLCIGNCTQTTTTLNAFNFHESNPHEYIHAKWDVIEQCSPFRQMVDSSLKMILMHPHTSCASYLSETKNKVDIPRGHWLTDSIKNVETMKIFVSIVNAKFPDSDIQTEMSDAGEPIISIIKDDIYLRFPYEFPQVKPIIQDRNGNKLELCEDFIWETDSDLISRFGQLINHLYSQSHNTLSEEQSLEESKF